MSSVFLNLCACNPTLVHFHYVFMQRFTSIFEMFVCLLHYFIYVVMRCMCTYWCLCKLVTDELHLLVELTTSPMGQWIVAKSVPHHPQNVYISKKKGRMPRDGNQVRRLGLPVGQFEIELSPILRSRDLRAYIKKIQK